jgi:hypothetical protein
VDLSAHALERAGGAQVIIELGESGEDGFEKLALWICINGFRDRNDLYLLLEQDRLYVEVIADIACQSVNFPYEKTRDTIPAISAELAELHEFQELRTVGKFGGLSLLDKHFEHFDLIAVRLFPARQFLRL